MTTFDDREKGFESKYALDQAQEFKLAEQTDGWLGSYSTEPVLDTASLIPGSTVHALLSDDQYNLWIGTDHGLSRLDTRRGAWRQPVDDCPQAETLRFALMGFCVPLGVCYGYAVSHSRLALSCTLTVAPDWCLPWEPFA